EYNIDPVGNMDKLVDIVALKLSASSPYSWFIETTGRDIIKADLRQVVGKGITWDVAGKALEGSDNDVTALDNLFQGSAIALTLEYLLKASLLNKELTTKAADLAKVPELHNAIINSIGRGITFASNQDAENLLTAAKKGVTQLTTEIKLASGDVAPLRINPAQLTREAANHIFEYHRTTNGVGAGLAALNKLNSEVAKEFIDTFTRDYAKKVREFAQKAVSSTTVLEEKYYKGQEEALYAYMNGESLEQLARRENQNQKLLQALNLERADSLKVIGPIIKEGS
ncbi:MAG: hypothetical protein NTY47_03815, partial [Candidatus Omnitrophica bacterium]|nr:hypothetical protein [Candidatus Omnitrophota bacterium]